MVFRNWRSGFKKGTDVRNLVRNAFDSPLGSGISPIGVISRLSLPLSWMDGERKQLIELTVCASVINHCHPCCCCSSSFLITLSLTLPIRLPLPLSLLQLLSIHGMGEGSSRKRRKGKDVCKDERSVCVAKPRVRSSFALFRRKLMRMKEMRLAIKSPLEEGHPS